MASADHIKDILRTLWLFLFAVVTMPVGFILAFLVWLFTVLFDRRLVILHLYSCFWASLYTLVAPFWKVTIEGKEKIDRRKVYVMVSNHQSMLDILVLYRLFVHFKWVAKIELYKIPLVGWNMSLNRYIRLRRGQRSSILHMIRDGKEMLLSGSSLMIFPEGTRSVTPEISRFKEGAFLLAKETGTPILPIILDGTGKAIPKHGTFIRGKHHLKVRVLDEIPPETFREMTTAELTSFVRETMIRELVKLRKES